MYSIKVGTLRGGSSNLCVRWGAGCYWGITGWGYGAMGPWEEGAIFTIQHPYPHSGSVLFCYDNEINYILIVYLHRIMLKVNSLGYHTIGPNRTSGMF